MATYIEVADVDSKLGPGWADADLKSRAVMIANVWLTNQRLPAIDPVPDEWVQAGAEIAREAARGRIFGAQEVGVLSKSVSAGDGVTTSKSFSPNAKTLTAGESLAMALLKPWLPNSSIIMLKRA